MWAPVDYSQQNCATPQDALLLFLLTSRLNHLAVVDTSGQRWPRRDRRQQCRITRTANGVSSSCYNARRRLAVSPLQVACHIECTRRSVVCAHRHRLMLSDTVPMCTSVDSE